MEDAIVLICGTIVSSLIIFKGSPAMAAFGVALSGLGLLATTGFVLAMDTFGPITDNAHGIFEMSKIKATKASDTLAWMDAIGNTTKALTKGLAIATAVIAATALFRSYIDEAALVASGIQINIPEIFVGLMIGAAVPMLFSSFMLKAVGRAAFLVVQEVRRQFKMHPGIMKGTELPEYGPCVAIVTEAAQRELVGPGVLAVATPVLVAFTLGVGALGGYLVGTIVVGQLLAVFMSNTGERSGGEDRCAAVVCGAVCDGEDFPGGGAIGCGDGRFFAGAAADIALAGERGDHRSGWACADEFSCGGEGQATGHHAGEPGARTGDADGERSLDGSGAGADGHDGSEEEGVEIQQCDAGGFEHGATGTAGDGGRNAVRADADGHDGNREQHGSIF